MVHKVGYPENLDLPRGSNVVCLYQHDSYTFFIEYFTALTSACSPCTGIAGGDQS